MLTKTAISTILAQAFLPAIVLANTAASTIFAETSVPSMLTNATALAGLALAPYLAMHTNAAALAGLAPCLTLVRAIRHAGTGQSGDPLLFLNSPESLQIFKMLTSFNTIFKLVFPPLQIFNVDIIQQLQMNATKNLYFIGSGQGHIRVRFMCDRV
jgi:hypothetical protein